MTAEGTALPDFDSFWNHDDPGGTETQFRSVLPLARSAGDVSYLAELLTQIARAQGLQQHFEDAHQTLEAVERLLPQAGKRAEVRYLLERGRVFNSARRPAAGRPLFLRALELSTEIGDDYHAVDAAHMMAILEPPEEQLVWHERAMERAKRSKDPRARRWLGSLYNNAGWTYHALDRYDDSLAIFQEGLQWQRQAGNDAAARIAAWAVGRALRSLGRYEDALELQLANLTGLEEIGHSDGYVDEEIGECLLLLGRDDEARPYFARAHALLADDPWLRRDEPARIQRLAELGCVKA